MINTPGLTRRHIYGALFDLGFTIEDWECELLTNSEVDRVLDRARDRRDEED